MIRFLTISFLCTLLYSCKPYQLQGVVSSENVETTVENRYFSDPETDYVYKAHIEVYGHDMSGLFIIKKISDTNHRVVFTTDFGNTLFDFEIGDNNDFKLNFIIDNLNKKIIINTLKKDFSFLLHKDYLSKQSFVSKDYRIYKVVYNDTNCYFYQSLQDNALVKLSATSKTKEKLVISFHTKNTTFAESIAIIHYNLQLKIELNKFNN